MQKVFLFLPLLLLSLQAASPEVNDYLSQLAEEAKKSDSTFKGFDAKRGETIFFKEEIQEGEKISCTSCHGNDLTQKGRNIKTGRSIRPLSPKANPNRLSDLADVKKWLRRNFKDVYGREGTALEKGDVLYYIQTQ